MKTRYILKDKRRFAVTIIVVITIILSVLLASTVYGYKKSSYKVIGVINGDTLWSLANQYSNRQDIRKYIYDLKEMNNLNSSIIYAGSQIKIPID